VASSNRPQLVAPQHSAVPSVAGPTFSVVVASTCEESRLIAQLASLATDPTAGAAELIIVRADARPRVLELTRAIPRARVIAAPGSSIAQLRSIGFANATGDIVALASDTDCGDTADPRWIEDLRRRYVRGLTSGSSAPETPSTPLQHPYLSVIVPAHQAGDALAQSLSALADSQLPRACWELIVVDDASTDNTASIAARFADLVVRLPRNAYGPAYARNRGFEVARGECLVFLDADVCVRPETLTQFALALGRGQPDVSAVFGSFDTRPSQGGVATRYRNLLASYYHQQSAGPADTFWSSCGAIRRAAFVEAGMFDEWHFPRRQIEDFELGRRLSQRGHQVALRPDIKVTHLKRRTFRGLIAADLYDRALPWMRLFGGRPTTGRRRNAQLRTLKKKNTAIMWLAALLGVLGMRWAWLLPVAGAAVALVLVSNRGQYRFFAREQGFAFLIAAVPLDLLSYLVHGVGVAYGWLLRELIGEPKPHPTVEAFAEVGVRMWPPVPRKRADDA
jgi:GT2 family glycosyltransferase